MADFGKVYAAVPTVTFHARDSRAASSTMRAGYLLDEPVPGAALQPA